MLTWMACSRMGYERLMHARTGSIDVCTCLSQRWHGMAQLQATGVHHEFTTGAWLRDHHWALTPMRAMQVMNGPDLVPIKVCGCVHACCACASPAKLTASTTCMDLSDHRMASCTTETDASFGPLGSETTQVVKREVAFSASARHDNIVRLLDVFAERAQLVIGAWLWWLAVLAFLGPGRLHGINVGCSRG